MEERKKVGALSAELLQQKPDTRDPIELEREMHKDYEKNVWDCVDRGKKENPGDFYVVVITKKERLMENVLRCFFTFRSTCPTPEYDQTLYRYHKDKDALEFLWTIPAKDICEMLLANAHDVVKEERDLLYFVMQFENGILLRKAKLLNGEKEDSVILEK